MAEKVIKFQTPEKFESWLSKNHNKTDVVWLRFFKKDSGVESMNYQQALDVALCYGWIDGQAKSYDKKSWIQRYTPRRPKSSWSKNNTERVARLIKEGKMKPSGLEQVEKAKNDGRWLTAYSSPKNAAPPEDFMRQLKKNKKAFEFFKTLNRQNTYGIIYRLETSKKPELRKKKIEKFIEMLAKCEKLH